MFNTNSEITFERTQLSVSKHHTKYLKIPKILKSLDQLKTFTQLPKKF